MRRGERAADRDAAGRQRRGGVGRRCRSHRARRRGIAAWIGPICNVPGTHTAMVSCRPVHRYSTAMWERPSRSRRRQPAGRRISARVDQNTRAPPGSTSGGGVIVISCACVFMPVAAPPAPPRPGPTTAAMSSTAAATAASHGRATHHAARPGWVTASARCWRPAAGEPRTGYAAVGVGRGVV